MKKLSIGSWAYLFNQDPPTTDFHTLVHKLGHMGYAGVELGGFAPHPTPESHDTREKRQKLRKMVVDHRQDFSGYVPEIRVQKIWNEDDYRPYLVEVEKHALFAEDLGIKTMRLDTVGPITEVQQAGVEPARLLDRCVRALDAAAKIAHRHGVTIAWEFEPNAPLHKPEEIIALVDAVRALGNPNFGVLFNTGHAHTCTGGSPLELLRSLKGKITHLHFSDSDGTLNEHNTSTRVPLGKGAIDFDALMPELMQSGVPHDWWCVDLSHQPEAWSLTSEGKRFLDKLRHKYAS